MLKFIDDTLAAKFLAGEASPEEAIIVNEWIEASVENKVYFKKLEEAWSLDVKNNQPIVKQEAWQSLQANLAKNESNGFGFYPHKIAAAILIVMMTCAGIYFYTLQNTKSELAWNVKQTTDEVASLNLADGTSITMNRKSRLKWSKQYSKTAREVSLDGEAFFDVAHNPTKPFIISTDEIKIKVLGTSFNVWHDYDHEEIKTNVARGKVMMYDANKSIVIGAGMTGVYHKHTKEFTITKSQNQNAIGYINHSLTFSNATINEITVELSKSYGVKFVFENEKLGNCRLTTQYKNKSLSFILNIIEESLNIKYNIKGDTVYISGDGCL
jgi:ferric-dicitrate binding protein FerR (iron transport regulator)